MTAHLCTKRKMRSRVVNSHTVIIIYYSKFKSSTFTSKHIIYLSSSESKNLLVDIFLFVSYDINLVKWNSWVAVEIFFFGFFSLFFVSWIFYFREFSLCRERKNGGRSKDSGVLFLFHLDPLRCCVKLLFFGVFFFFFSKNDLENVHLIFFSSMVNIFMF